MFHCSVAVMTMGKDTPWTKMTWPDGTSVTMCYNQTNKKFWAFGGKEIEPVEGDDGENVYKVENGNTFVVEQGHVKTTQLKFGLCEPEGGNKRLI